MNRRTLWILVLLAAIAALGYLVFRPGSPTPPTTVQAEPPPPATPAPTLPPPAPVAATIPATLPNPPSPEPVAPPEVPIEDRKTIDFSSGKAVVKDSPEEQAIMDAAAKEMAEAARGVTFKPVRSTTQSTTDQKSATADEKK